MKHPAASLRQQSYSLKDTQSAQVYGLHSFTCKLHNIYCLYAVSFTRRYDANYLHYDISCAIQFSRIQTQRNRLWHISKVWHVLIYKLLCIICFCFFNLFPQRLLCKRGESSHYLISFFLQSTVVYIFLIYHYFGEYIKRNIHNKWSK